MTEQRTPKQLRLSKFCWTLRILGCVYLLLAVVFLFFPTELFYLINVGPRVFKVTEAIPESPEKFWMVQSTALMVVLASLSFLGAESPYTRGYSLAHLLAKTVAACGFIYVFLNGQKFFAYLLGAGLEVLTALMLAWNLARIGRSPEDRPAGEPPVPASSETQVP